MELSLALAEQIASMVLICLAGFCLARFGIIKGDESRTLSQICVYVIIPASIINAFQTELDEARISGMLLGLVAAILLHAMYLGVTALFGVFKHPLQRVEQASVIYNNAGNLVFPMLYGTLGADYVVYTISYIVVQNLLMWSHGQVLMSEGEKISVKKIFMTPCMISIFTGLVLFFLRIPLPGALGIAVENTAMCVGPAAMLLVGLMLGGQDLKQVFTNLGIYRVVSLRLIAYPLMSMVVLLGLAQVWEHPDLENILTVSLLCAVGPAAGTIAQMAQLYQNPQRVYVSSINVVSTILAAITMPLMVMLFLFLI